MENGDKDLTDYLFEKKEVSLPFFRGSLLKVGETGELEFLSYEGINQFGQPVVKVKFGEKEYLFGLNITNRDILLSHGIKSVKELIGKKVKFVVIATNKGNSIQLIF